MGLGKTLELMLLIAARPATPQPFSLGDGATTATAALALALAHANKDAMWSTLLTLARMPSFAARAFESANNRALGASKYHMGRDRAAATSWAALNPFDYLGMTEGIGYVIDSRATLVLCPAALRSQWAAEIERWAGGRLSVVIFPGAAATNFWDAAIDMGAVDFETSTGMSRRSATDAGERQLRNMLALASADVVLVSHSELAKPSVAAMKKTRNQSVAGLPPETRIEFFNWTRIICDEIQLVSGAGGVAAGAARTATRSLEALLELQGSTRWPTSGTPLESAHEVGGILGFLQAQPFSSPRAWERAGPRKDRHAPTLTRTSASAEPLPTYQAGGTTC